jgi:hypothetical protein
MSGYLIKEKIWLIGTGSIAVEYSKVLESLEVGFALIGRRNINQDKFPNSPIVVIEGGFENIDNYSYEIPKLAFVVVNVENLYSVTKKCISLGVKNILVEKPGSLNTTEIRELCSFAKSNLSNVYVAYNRRFFQTTKWIKDAVSQFGKFDTVHFEFTEWTERLKNTIKSEKVFSNWFFANSTHLIDLVFFIVGDPTILNSYSSKSDGIISESNVFAGSGITTNGTFFSYNSNWGSTGNWSIVLSTKGKKFLLSPLEEIKIQSELGVNAPFNLIEMNNSVDQAYKAGFFEMLSTFINEDFRDHLSIFDQCKKSVYYDLIQFGGNLKIM